MHLCNRSIKINNTEVNTEGLKVNQKLNKINQISQIIQNILNDFYITVRGRWELEHCKTRAVTVPIVFKLRNRNNTKIINRILRN